jgi:hypothetical protein
MARIQKLHRELMFGRLLTLQGQPMYYEGFSANMKQELITSEIGTSILPLSDLVLAKIQELADAQLKHEEFADEVTKEQRRIQLVAQLHDVVSQMTDRMIARLNSNSFIRVPSLTS